MNAYLLRFNAPTLNKWKDFVANNPHGNFAFELDYIVKAIEDLKSFAEKSTDKNGILIDEAFRQFDQNDSTVILYKPLSLLHFEEYRNLGFVYSSEEYETLSKALYFFNECLDDLFAWLVNDLKCTMFKNTWESWRNYKTGCETEGMSAPYEEEPFALKRRLDALYKAMTKEFDSLKGLKLPRLTDAPRDYKDVGVEIDRLLVDGSDLLNPDPTISLPICFTKLTEYLNSCIYCETWGIFGEKLFIRLVCTLKDINKFDISNEESNKLNGLWLETRSSFINFLERLKPVTNSSILSQFYEWLNKHKDLALPSQENCTRQQLNACILKELPIWCRNLILDICEETLLDIIRDSYDGMISAWFDRLEPPAILPQGRSINMNRKTSLTEDCNGAKLDQIFEMEKSNHHLLLKINEQTKTQKEKEAERQNRHNAEDNALALWEQYTDGRLGPPVHKGKKRSKADLLEHSVAAQKLRDLGITTIETLQKAIRNAENRHKSHQSGKN